MPKPICVNWRLCCMAQSLSMWFMPPLCALGGLRGWLVKLLSAGGSSTGAWPLHQPWVKFFHKTGLCPKKVAMTKGPVLSNFPTLMQPYHPGVCCILLWGGSHGGLLKVRESLFPYLRASLLLCRCWKVGYDYAHWEIELHGVSILTPNFKTQDDLPQ